MNSYHNWLQRLQILSLASIIFTSLFVLVVFIMLGQYAYPSADDFCMASGVRDEGLIQHLWKHYLAWSGRYTGNALYAIYPLIFGMFKGPALMPGMIIIMIFAATLFLLSTVFNISPGHKKLWIITLVIVCTYLLGLRHTASSLYWMAGALTYQSGHILLLLLFTFILRLKRLHDQQKSSVASYLILVILIVLGVGSNEINMLVIAAVMAVVWLHAFIAGDGSLRVWLWIFLISLICFAIVYFSPGNTVRESTFPLRHDWMRSLKGSFDMGSWTLLVWTGSPVFIVASLLTPFAVSSLSLDAGQQFKISNRMLFFQGLLTFSLPVVLQFPAWWAMGGWPPPRTVDAIFFLFLTSWIVLLSAFSLRFIPMSRLYDNRQQLRPKASIILFVLTLCFIFSVSISTKFNTAWQDLRFNAAPFYDAMMHRHDLIAQSTGQGKYYINVPDLPDQLPLSIYFNDIRADWRDWRNVCYARYFGLLGIQRIINKNQNMEKIKSIGGKQ